MPPGGFSIAPARTARLNTLRPPLLPIACWRMDDIRFEFDASFLLPAARRECTQLADLVRAHPRSPASIFGHADPTGTSEYNKRLSGRRATVIFALLTRNAHLWEEIYGAPAGGDAWGRKSLQMILSAVSDGLGTPYYAGAIDGRQNAGYEQAIEAFQADHGVPERDPKALREALFLAYMSFLTNQEGSLDPWALKPEDFLGKGADAGGKGAYQGCSEFNPSLVFSTEEGARLDAFQNHSERNERNAENRRVIVYLFAPGITVRASSWPCPRVKEGSAGCKEHFWSDGEARRTPAIEERQYGRTRDTFACRFYDGLSHRSPCEGVAADSTFYEVRVLDERETPIAGLEIIMSTPAGTGTVTTGDDGRARVRGAPKGAGSARVASAAQFAALTAGWEALPRRDDALPSGDTWQLLTPSAFATEVPLKGGKATSLMILTRTDIIFYRSYSPWLEPHLTGAPGPFKLDARPDGIKLSLHSNGLGRTVVVECNQPRVARVAGDPPTEPVEWFRADVDDLNEQNHLGGAAALSSFLAGLTRDPPPPQSPAAVDTGDPGDSASLPTGPNERPLPPPSDP
jgi:OmpA family